MVTYKFRSLLTTPDDWSTREVTAPISQTSTSIVIVVVVTYIPVIMVMNGRTD
jgi:hypothetical protein